MPNGPIVSHATGTNMYGPESVAYFVSFLAAAELAAPAGETEVEMRWDAARVSATVTSQIKLLPACQGIKVRPSGLLPSDLDRPDGSLTDGTPALERLRHMMSLRAK